MIFKKTVKGVTDKEIRQGVAVEMEHTSNPNVARKIAIDHLAETGPGYYPALKKMEKNLEKVSFAFFDEIKKISGVSEAAGALVGRTARKAISAPGRFVSSVREGFRGATPMPFAPSRATASGDPDLAKSVQKAMKRISKKKAESPKTGWAKFKMKPEKSKSFAKKSTIGLSGRSSVSSPPTRGGW
jgi:hypothetical protein